MSVIIAFMLALLVASTPGAFTHQGTVGPVDVDGDTVTRIVLTHPGSESIQVAGEVGLYATTGNEWLEIAPTPPVGQVASSGGDSPILLAGDHAPCMRGGASVPLQRSADGGSTWEPVAGVTDFRPLAIWSDTGLALASSCPGLQMSEDGGVTWSLVPGIDPGWDLTSFAVIPQEDGSGPVVLIGLTGEGGTSYLHRVDFTDPAAPVVSESLREYYAIGGLTGSGDTYVLAAMDGVWISNDAGTTWKRSAAGLGDVVLERDPLVDGLPQDMAPNAYGLFAAAELPGERPGIVVGSVDGLFISFADGDSWMKVDGTSGRVNQIAVAANGTPVVFATDEGVYQVDITTP